MISQEMVKQLTPHGEVTKPIAKLIHMKEAEFGYSTCNDVFTFKKSKMKVNALTIAYVQEGKNLKVAIVFKNHKDEYNRKIGGLNALSSLETFSTNERNLFRAHEHFVGMTYVRSICAIVTPEVTDCALMFLPRTLGEVHMSDLRNDYLISFLKKIAIAAVNGSSEFSNA